MEISVRKDGLRLTDKRMTPLSYLFVTYNAEYMEVGLCAYQPEKGEQHDFVLSLEEWNRVRDFIDQKTKETENV